MYKKSLVEFHKAVFNKTGDYRTDLNQELVIGSPTAVLRAELIREECNELIDALLLEDKEQVLKELCDVLYVTFGLAVVYDLSIKEAFERVHENNMLKVHTGFINENGKLCKAKDHPKVILKDLVDDNL